MAVRRFALVFGALYVLVGLVGFALAGSAISLQAKGGP